MSYSLRVARRAADQIRAASAWWTENRTKAPAAFAEEIERGFGLIQAIPGLGEAVAHPEIDEVRRLHLGRIRYHLYYRVNRGEETVEVLALWHTSRRESPLPGAR